MTNKSQPTSELYSSKTSNTGTFSLRKFLRHLPMVGLLVPKVRPHRPQVFKWGPEAGYIWDWHKWLHLRWWRIWLTTERCPNCGTRRPYSVTETICIACMQTNFGYPIYYSTRNG